MSFKSFITNCILCIIDPSDLSKLDRNHRHLDNPDPSTMVENFHRIFVAWKLIYR